MASDAPGEDSARAYGASAFVLALVNIVLASAPYQKRVGGDFLLKGPRCSKPPDLGKCPLRTITYCALCPGQWDESLARSRCLLRLFLGVPAKVLIGQDLYVSVAL